MEPWNNNNDQPDSAEALHKIEEEDVVELRPIRRPPSSRKSVLWDLCGKRVPRGEIVFFFQIILIYVAVCVSLYNLSLGGGPDRLWVALLSSCLGYLLPNPSIDPPSRR